MALRKTGHFLSSRAGRGGGFRGGGFPIWTRPSQFGFVRPNLSFFSTFKWGVTERGVFAFACQYIVSPRGRTGNRTVTQMRHPLLVEGRPNCARQSLASTLSAPRVAATSCCDPGRHANVITPCLLTPCLNVPNFSPVWNFCRLVRGFFQFCPSPLSRPILQEGEGAPEQGP